MSESAASPTPSRQTLWDRVKEWLTSGSLETTGTSSRQDELLASLRPLGSLRVDRIDLPGTTVSLRITRAAHLDPILDTATGRMDLMPVWAEIWPSGIVLAGMVAREPGAFHGKRVLELGPGVGITAIAALRAGADLVVADYDARALALCALNALDQAGREPVTLAVNWRKSSAKLRAAADEGFAVILAADVLYAPRDVEPLLELVERILAPDGELWLAEPGRADAKRFVQMLRERGWTGTSEECASPRPDPHHRTWDVVTVYRLRRPQA
jgi:predicted nicotinamide N-methyase